MSECFTHAKEGERDGEADALEQLGVLLHGMNLASKCGGNGQVGFMVHVCQRLRAVCRMCTSSDPEATRCRYPFAALSLSLSLQFVRL